VRGFGGRDIGDQHRVGEEDHEQARPAWGHHAREAADEEGAHAPEASRSHHGEEEHEPAGEEEHVEGEVGALDETALESVARHVLHGDRGVEDDDDRDGPATEAVHRGDEQALYARWLLGHRGCTRRKSAFSPPPPARRPGRHSAKDFFGVASSGRGVARTQACGSPKRSPTFRATVYGKCRRGLKAIGLRDRSGELSRPGP